MDLERRNFRAMIYYDFNRGLTQEECLEQLFETISDAAPSKATVFRWLAEFRRGRASLQNGLRPGKPTNAVLPGTISAVDKM